MSTVETVRGPVDAQALGRTLMHEHILLVEAEALANYSHAFGESYWDEEVRVADAVAKLRAVREAGVAHVGRRDTALSWTVKWTEDPRNGVICAERRPAGPLGVPRQRRRDGRGAHDRARCGPLAWLALARNAERTSRPPLSAHHPTARIRRPRDRPR